MVKMHYFLTIQTLKLSNDNRKKQRNQGLVGLTVGRIFNYFPISTPIT
jgi:hypothetical protein